MTMMMMMMMLIARGCRRAGAGQMHCRIGVANLCCWFRGLRTGRRRTRAPNDTWPALTRFAAAPPARSLGFMLEV
jgi:hypothetical protein